jgi:hypothetical protein
MLPLADLAEKKKKMTKEKGVWDDKGYDKKSLLTVWINQKGPVEAWMQPLYLAVL